MLLKSIEIRGFKSFADKTILNFERGTTAVVGPNGSGKSNISDAVRWVLGEQSVKSLRGGKMEDVIFAGTEFRKPVGLAQVSLTLDNTDRSLDIEYTDVTVSRRLYRSGESEYYINNTQCRLRDIQELFMDTGIGKEGYSIIGQGKIDAILSGRPEERRGLLEEAAGIVKFKARKEEAEKRLNNTEQNLIRINDILSTYEERLEPLRIENEKAKEFVVLSEELKQKEVTLVLHSIEKIQGVLLNYKNTLNNLQEELIELEKDKIKTKNELEVQNSLLEAFEKQNNDERSYYYDLKNKYQASMAEITLLNERIENLKSSISKASKELEEAQQKSSNLGEDKSKMEFDLIDFQDEQNSINEEISILENKIEEFNSLVEVEQRNAAKFRADEIEFLRKISEAKNSVNILSNNMGAAEKKIESMNSVLDNYTNSITINDSTRKALLEEVEKVKALIKSYEEQISYSKREINKKNNELNSDEQTLRNLNTNLNKYEANHNMLINLEKHYEGYNKATKNLMQHVDNGKIPEVIDKCFVLGNVIEVDSKLETAIEIALGGAISDIITNDEDTAKKLIKYLKDNNLGRGTFLPLNIIRSKTANLNSQVMSLKGFIGLGSNLVKFEDTFQKAIEYVLGRTLIADSMESALNIAKQINYSYKVVTLSGEVINPGGSLTGGSTYSKSANIIGRKREIEDIELKIAEHSEALEKLQIKINNSKSIVKELDIKCLNLRDEMHFKHIDITKLEERITAIINETEKLKLNKETSKDEMEYVVQTIDKYKSEIQSKEREIEEYRIKEAENQEAIDTTETLIKEREQDISKFKENLLEYKIRKAQRDEVVSNKIKELQRVERELQQTVTKSEDYLREIASSEMSINASLSLIQQNEKQLLDISSLMSEMEKKFEKYEADKAGIKDKIKLLSEQYEMLNEVFMSKENEKHKIDVSQAKLETEIETMYQKLNEELKLTYAEASKLKLETYDYDKLRSNIAYLKSKISSLGIINLGAIEEYEQTKEKHSFMSAQRDDLTKSKNELCNLILDMTNKMKEVFEENFKILRFNFNETFKELFKGGSADLLLSEGDELTANIDITVQPPGKKLQNINLMSGGEKVLSAIALLFAILKMKPTPFCILDEIEAALDDANVFRYAEFLTKFSNNIQFIVITHRKGTMEASDVLYGVTMEEKGVSKIVSVNLNKENVTPEDILNNKAAI
jgi:chromosome segregation protein